MSAAKDRAVSFHAVKSFFDQEDKASRTSVFQCVEIEEKSPLYLEEESMFCYVVDGQGSLFVNGLDFELKSGAFIWLQSYHVYRVTPAPHTRIKMYFCLYEYSLMHYLAYRKTSPNENKSLLSNSPVVFLNSADQQKALQLFREFEQELQQEKAGSILIRTGIYGQLSLLFSRERHRSFEQEQFRQTPLIWDILLFIGKNQNMKLDAKYTARHFRISISQLNQELRMLCGYNFSQFLSRCRIGYASSLLLFQEISLDNLGKIVGYQSEVAFYRSFKEYRGMTPQEYRKRILDSGNLLQKHMISSVFPDVYSYLLLHFSENISIKDVAQELFLSENMINKILLQKRNMNFHHTLCEIRLCHAASLLKISDMPIVDIAVAAGFNSPRTFSRQFKNKYACSPAEYRVSKKEGAYYG